MKSFCCVIKKGPQYTCTESCVLLWQHKCGSENETSSLLVHIHVLFYTHTLTSSTIVFYMHWSIGEQCPLLLFVVPFNYMYTPPPPLSLSHTHSLHIQFMRYLHTYDSDAGIQIVPCNRYSNESCGAKIIVTKQW